MVLQKNPNLHLAYCLNVHPGETWAENLAAIWEKALAVKARVAKNKPFGLGLRLGRRSAEELSKPGRLDEFCEFLDSQELYVFTINGFPYGRFHGSRVKEKVYRPDWRTKARRDYTVQLADILARLLPPGVTGSISTVPCSFKPWIRRKSEASRMVEKLMDCAAHLDFLFKKTGKEIHLGLEPEPGCFLETTEEFARFFNERLLGFGEKYLQSRLKCSAGRAETILRRHLGVCFDTCHAAIQFEDLVEALDRYQEEGVRISKIQISAALEADTSPKSLKALKAFIEPTYLHQTVLQPSAFSLQPVYWPDLPEALKELSSLTTNKPTSSLFSPIPCPLSPVPSSPSLRIHFHVPLFWEGSGRLCSTAQCLTPNFFKKLKMGVCPHLEMETYTFDVLPKKLRSGGVVNSIIREYEWMLGKMGAKQNDQPDVLRGRSFSICATNSSRTRF